MKFGRIAYLAYLSTSFVFSQEAQINFKNEEQDSSLNINDSSDGSAATDTPPSIGLNIAYNVVDKPEVPTGQPLEIEQDEVMMLNYTLINEEESDFSVVGVSGNIISHPGFQVVTKITFGELNDLYATPNDTLNFRQKVAFNLQPGTYYVFPLVHVINETAKAIEQQEAGVEMVESEIKPLTIAAPPTLFTIEEPIMSIFDPQFLSIQIGALAIIGAVSYYYMYIRGGANNRRRSKGTNKAAANKDPQQWLPEQYKNEK